MALNLLSGISPEIMALLQEEYLAEPPSGFDTILEEENEDDEDDEEDESSAPPPEGSSPIREESRRQLLRIPDSSPKKQQQRKLSSSGAVPTKANPSVCVLKEDGIHISTKLQALTCDSSSTMRRAISSE